MSEGSPLKPVCINVSPDILFKVSVLSSEIKANKPWLLQAPDMIFLECFPKMETFLWTAGWNSNAFPRHDPTATTLPFLSQLKWLKGSFKPESTRVTFFEAASQRNRVKDDSVIIANVSPSEFQAISMDDLFDRRAGIK